MRAGVFCFTGRRTLLACAVVLGCVLPAATGAGGAGNGGGDYVGRDAGQTVGGARGGDAGADCNDGDAIGGVMGLALLALRFAVFESGLFDAMKSESSNLTRGLLPILKSWTLALRLVKVVVVGMPIWFTLAILVGLAPKIASEMGLSPAPKPGHLVALFYSGAIFGDIASGLLSQRLKSRKIPIGIFMFGTTVDGAK